VVVVGLLQERKFVPMGHVAVLDREQSFVQASSSTTEQPFYAAC
jgi:hypothetical protein